MTDNVVHLRDYERTKRQGASKRNDKASRLRWKGKPVSDELTMGHADPEEYEAPSGDCA